MGNVKQESAECAYGQPVCPDCSTDIENCSCQGSVEESGSDVVNNPSHYQLFPGVEAIEVIAKSLTPEEFRGYCKGSILKYRLRAGKKDKAEQDLSKADKYIELYNKYK